MPHVPVGCGLYQNHLRAVDIDALFAFKHVATNCQAHVRRGVIHAIHQRHWRALVHTADKRCQQQTFRIAVAAVKQNFPRRAQAATIFSILHSVIAPIIHLAIWNCVLHKTGQRLNALARIWSATLTAPIGLNHRIGNVAHFWHGAIKNPLMIRRDALRRANNSVLRQGFRDGFFNCRLRAIANSIRHGIKRMLRKSKVALERVGPRLIHLCGNANGHGRATRGQKFGVAFTLGNARLVIGPQRKL